ncbi:MAG: DUF402 domain-containing protein [Chloroflexi bacterium]|nr:DUF402 domain-containing protein [Chloroflexota bacterium]
MSDQTWRIYALKYNQKLHYTLPAHLLHEDGQMMVFQAVQGGQIDHQTRGMQFPIQRRSDMIFFRNRWYNVYRNYRHADPTLLDHIYCNIGLPPVISDLTVAFVDLDLDVQLWPDGRWEVLDADEFDAHAAEMHYPDDVRRIARQVVHDILALWDRREYPFNV